MSRSSVTESDAWTVVANIGNAVRTSASHWDEVSTAKPVPVVKPFDIVKAMWVFGGPIVFVVGICGNVLVLIVMSRRQMKGTSTSVHLSLMALADIVVLVSGLIPEWLEAALGYQFKELHGISCKVEKFVFYTSADTSIWILVIFTLDRFIAICFPLKKRSCCLQYRAKFYALTAMMVAILKNLHVFWTRGAQYKTVRRLVNGTNITLDMFVKNCGRPTKEFEDFEKYVRPYIVFVTVNIIPFVVIIVCNVFIIRALFAVQRMRSEQCIVSNSDKSMVQMTTMCLSASFCFLICITPSIVLLIGRPYWDKFDKYHLAKGINNQLVYVNHSVNFFLYCVTGRRFRLTIVSLFRRGGRRFSEGDSRMPVIRGAASPVSTRPYRLTTNNGGTTYSRVEGRRITEGLLEVHQSLDFNLESKRTSSVDIGFDMCV